MAGENLPHNRATCPEARTAGVVAPDRTPSAACGARCAVVAIVSVLPAGSVPVGFRGLGFRAARARLGAQRAIFGAADQRLVIGANSGALLTLGFGSTLDGATTVLDGAVRFPSMVLAEGPPLFSLHQHSVDPTSQM